MPPQARPVTLLATGDLIIDEPDPDSYFAPLDPCCTRPTSCSDTSRCRSRCEREASANVPLEARDPRKLSALANAGVVAASLAANHLYDEGVAGVRDTLDGLRARASSRSARA